MPSQRVSGLTTISGHGQQHWEYWFGDGVDVGPCFAQPEILNDYNSTGSEIVANNQGVISKWLSVGNGMYDAARLTYTVDIQNRGNGATQYFLRVGRF